MLSLVDHESTRLDLEKLVVLIVEFDANSIETRRGLWVLKAKHV